MKPIVASLVMLTHCLTNTDAQAFYNPSTGRWLSRDAIEEQGGMHLFGFVRNDPSAAIDPLGMDILCNCPEPYFKALGLLRDVHYTITGASQYAAKKDVKIGYSKSLEKEIIWQMLRTSHTFTARDLKVEHLKRHVAARATIVNNALRANFLFDTGNKQDWTGFRDDPQAFFNKLNNGRTAIACQALSQIIFETGNNFGNESRGTWSEGRRNYDGVWVPGDWGYIKNSAYTDDGDWTDEQGRNRGLQGENVFYTGGGLFWGHFMSGKHPAFSESAWWAEIQEWVSKSGKHGVPEWRSYLKYPTTGLQK